jgi:hypothetical protein
MFFAFNYVENSINEEEQRNVTLYIVARDVKLDFRFDPQRVLILTGRAVLVYALLGWELP